MATLAEGIQGLVQHMRNDQQLMKEQIARQGDQQKQMLQLMEKLDGFFDKASKS